MCGAERREGQGGMRKTSQGVGSRTGLKLATCAALAAGSLAMAFPTESQAQDAMQGYVDCKWTPFKEAWACALPTTFTQGRFGAPPDFKHDELSEQLRARAYAGAKATPGA